MCGIAGIYSDGALEHVPIVKRMVSHLIHRGPDSSGFWSSGSYSAGMRRLSIVDVGGGDQPLYDESGRIILFYNGEIYNYPQLKKELENDGITFRTQGDGEVICHLYRKYGKDVFPKLDGMFAVALWDDEKQVLILARDFPGEKPLYYSRLHDGGVAFSSEIPSLLACDQVSREIDIQSLWDFPTYLWVPEPATIYKHVRAILPGEGLVISKRGVEPFEFKSRIAVPDLPIETDALAVESSRIVVMNSVKSRLLSDVPIGAFLSGGLDSSIVCALARQELNTLHTFCVGFEQIEDPYHGYSDESSLAEEFARHLGTRHTTVRVSGRDFRELLPQFLKAAGQPYGVSSGLGILAIAREARRQNIKVLLSGDGADEAFGGYSWYSAIPRSFTSHPVRGKMLRFLDGSETSNQKDSRMAGYSPQVRAWAWHYYASEQEKMSIFHPDIRAASSLHCFDGVKLKDPIDYLQHDRDFYFPNEMLSKVDRMTMAYSVEGRAPFASPALQRFAARLPWEQLIRNGQLKWVLRQAFQSELPEELLFRPKHGFNVPIDHWLRGEWRDLFEETFSKSSHLSKAGILSTEARDYAWGLLKDPTKIVGHVLFCFIMLNLWMSEKNVH